MNSSALLIDILVFLAAAVIVVPVFARFRSSPTLGYLAAGLAIGPHGLALITEAKSADAMAELGVVFLLFTIGLSLSTARLRSVAFHVFGLGTAQVVVTGAIIAAIALALGIAPGPAAVIGGGLALSSTAFVLQLLSERGERASRFGLVAFAILLLQDLAVVPLLMFVQLLGESGSSFGAALGLAALKSAIALAVIMGLGRLLVRPLYRMIAATRSAELFVAATLLLVLGSGWLMALAGLSMTLGAFLAGVLLAETEYRHQIEADLQPFRGLLLGLFFMTIGMSIDIALILRSPGALLAIVIALLAGKSVLIAGLCRLFGLPMPTAVRIGATLSQGGEFGFVLFGAAAALGLMATETAQILLAAIALTMAATPMMIALGARIACRMEPSPAHPVEAFADEIEGLKRHVVIAGFGRVGQTVAKVLAGVGIDYVALDLDHQLVARCRARGMPVYYGDANRVRVLHAAGAERASAAVVTLDDEDTASRVVSALRANNPDMLIFVRARDMAHARRLEREGASKAVPETVEASLQLGRSVLAALDVGEGEIAKVMQECRGGDYAELEAVIRGINARADEEARD